MEGDYGGAWEKVAASAGGDWPALPGAPGEQARKFLLDLYEPSDTGEWGAMRLRWYDGAWWRYEGARWVRISDDGVQKDARHWLSRHKVINKKLGGWVPYIHTERSVTTLLSNVRAEVLVEPRGDQRAPCWLPAEFDDGAPVFIGRRPWETVLSEEEALQVGLPDPRLVIAFPNGLMDVEAWKHGEVVMRPHTERLFNLTSLPYELPVEDLKRALAAGGLEELIARLCPTWLRFLEAAFPEDADAREDQGATDLLQVFMGKSLTPDTSDETILLLVGQAGAGKGTIATAWRYALGAEAIATPSFNDLTRPFFLASLQGKGLLLPPDAGTGRSTDRALCGEVLKKISGRDQVFADRKHKDPMNIVLPCHVAIMSNDMIEIPDPGGALAKRFRVIHMQHGHRGGSERPEFKAEATMRSEAVGRLIWMLDGLRKRYRLGRIPQPVSGQHLLDLFMAQSEPVGRFADECLEFRGDYEADVPELFAAWCQHCEEIHWKHPGTDATFAKALVACGRGAIQHVETKKKDPSDPTGKRLVRRSFYRGVRVLPGYLKEAEQEDAARGTPGGRRGSLWRGVPPY